MVQGSDILNYTGNVGLGLNSDGIAEYGETDVKDLNAAVFNLAYLNHQKNKEVYQQKIKDRDASQAAVAEGKLETNQVLPEHRAQLQGAIDKVKKIFYDNGGDIKSNNKVWLEANAELAKFKDADAQAKANLITYNKGMQEAAVETNPIKKKKMIEHWDNEKKKAADAIFLPYQQTLDYDVAKTLPGAVTTTTSTRVGQNDVQTTTTDIQRSYDKYIMDYMTNDKGETKPNVDVHYSDMYTDENGQPEEAIANRVQITNDLLKKIAIKNGYDISGSNGPFENGLKPLPDALKPIKIVKDPASGKWRTVDRPDVAMAKTNLALNYKSGQTSTPNPKYADIDLKNAQAKKANMDAESNRIKALADKNLKGNQGSYYRAKARDVNSKVNQSEKAASADNAFDYIPTVVQKSQDGTLFINQTDLTPGLIDIAGGVGRDKKPMPLPTQKLRIKDKDGSVISGWYFRPIKNSFYSADGKLFTQDVIAKYALQKGLSVDAATKQLIDNKTIYQDGEVYTQQGKGTRLSTFQSTRALNNPLTGKGDENVMINDIPEPPETPEP